VIFGVPRTAWEPKERVCPTCHGDGVEVDLSRLLFGAIPVHSDVRCPEGIIVLVQPTPSAEAPP
jgi:hypothetical protein